MSRPDKRDYVASDDDASPGACSRGLGRSCARKESTGGGGARRREAVNDAALW